MSGVANDRLAIWLASITAFTNFSFTLVGVWLVEKVGRRKLTLGSLTGMWIVWHLFVCNKLSDSVLYVIFLFFFCNAIISHKRKFSIFPKTYSSQCVMREMRRKVDGVQVDT